MHPILKRKCKQPMLIYPYLGSVDGDKTFGEAVTQLCYSESKIRVINNLKGQEVISMSTILMDDTNIGLLKENVEVSLEHLGRRPIINFQIFPALNGDGIEHLEVYV